MKRHLLWVSLLVILLSCAATPPPPDWAQDPAAFARLYPAAWGCIYA
jgi:hypothetical protein